MQRVIGPTEDHANLAVIPPETSLYNIIENALPCKLTNV